MSAKVKRVIYSDSDAHRLVDIVTGYSGVVECKRTDLTTWKEKDDAWLKITDMYNSGATEPRTSDQLRTKFDNLKKDVRKYYARERRELYKTGGGVIDMPEIRDSLQSLYKKILAIIKLSVEGMVPHPNDSDAIAAVPSCSSKMVDISGYDETDATFEIEMERPIINEDTNYGGPYHDVEENMEVGTYITSPIPNVVQSQSVKIIDKVEADVNTSTWNSYTPVMLRSKKHPLLTPNRSVSNPLRNSMKMMSAPAKVYAELAKAKKEVAELKVEILRRDAINSNQLHKLRFEKEEELYNLRIESIKLKNKKLELEISKLEK